MQTEFYILQPQRTRAKTEAIRQHNADKSMGRTDMLYSKRDTLDCTTLGLLAEIVLEDNLTLRKCEGHAVYKKGDFDPDFFNHLGESIEVKSTDPTPDKVKDEVLFNESFHDRKTRAGKLGKFAVFAEFSDQWKVATRIKLIGFIETSEIPNYPVNPNRTDLTPAFHIPKSKLRTDFETILRNRK